MSFDFISRILGMALFALLGARLGVDTAEFISYPREVSATLFGLSGALIGLVITPWITVRPFSILRRTINGMPVEMLLMAFLGAGLVLVITLLLAYPLSLLGEPLGTLLPLLVSSAGLYLGATTFAVRSRELWSILVEREGSRNRSGSTQGDRQLLLDTSVLIDGRIVEIAKSGFLGGVLLVPRFVLSELHQVADSSDTLRRNRGRHGLNKLNELQRNEVTMVKMIEDDIEDIPDVDNKLIALAQRINADIVTNDYNLNKVANAQGVNVLNINLLANAVRSVYIPGETFTIHVIQEGRDAGQGVGYLKDGTMVVIENGKTYMDRHINVMVTRLINRETGRMIFAIPEDEKARFSPSSSDDGSEA